MSRINFSGEGFSNMEFDIDNGEIDDDSLTPRDFDNEVRLLKRKSKKRNRGKAPVGEM